MTVQYVSDSTGRTTAVLVQIDDWNNLKRVHPDVDTLEEELPEWQKELLDKRHAALQQNPHIVTPLADFLSELAHLDDGL